MKAVKGRDLPVIIFNIRKSRFESIDAAALGIQSHMSKSFFT